MQFARFSRSLTKAANFQDKRSRIGVRFDGTLRYDLAGEDKKALRERVFQRDGYKCQYTDAGPCSGPLELSHWPPMGRSAGSDQDNSCDCLCIRHHRLRDNNQPQFGKKNPAPSSADSSAREAGD